MAIRQAADFIGNHEASAFRDMARVLGPYQKIESPIEGVFWVWWAALQATDQRMSLDTYAFGLAGQYEVVASDGSRFRLDFAVPDFQVAIELDGHEFHERTKDQVAYRNMRDRKLTADGWQVFHISGSELWRSPLERVSEVYSFCSRLALVRQEERWSNAFKTEVNGTVKA